MKKLVIFDVCGTIYDGNSTIDYCKFLINCGYKKHFKLCFSGSAQILLTILRKISGISLERKIIGLYFKGLSKKELIKHEVDFFLKYKKKIIRNNLIKHFLKNKNNEIILISASIDPPITLLSNYINVKFFSSTLQEKNNKYSGRIYPDLLSNKSYIFVNEEIKLSKFDKIFLITDNKSDIELITYFLKSRIDFCLKIVKNSDFDKDFWEKILPELSLKNNNFCYEFIQ